MPDSCGDSSMTCASGEIVTFSAKADWTFRIGRVVGPYRYDATGDGSYPHRRSVEWLKTLSRDELSQSARFELGAAMSFFRVRRHATEILSKIDIGGDLPIDMNGETNDEQPDVLSAGQVEEATREFVLERLRAVYAGHALEEFVGDLLRAMGYQAEVTQKSGDHGVDVVAGRGALGLDPPILKVQVKSGQGAVGEPDLLKLNGSIEQAQGERGIVVSLGGFTPPALKWKQGKQWFQLVGPGDLVDLVVQHYDQLAAEHRENLPLRRVYAPDIAGGTVS
ncbi:MAG: restriction endonuclease [Thermoleophilia bacterium]